MDLEVGKSMGSSGKNMFTEVPINYLILSGKSCIAKIMEATTLAPVPRPTFL